MIGFCSLHIAVGFWEGLVGFYSALLILLIDVKMQAFVMVSAGIHLQKLRETIHGLDDSSTNHTSYLDK